MGVDTSIKTPKVQKAEMDLVRWVTEDGSEKELLRCLKERDRLTWRAERALDSELQKHISRYNKYLTELPSEVTYVKLKTAGRKNSRYIQEITSKMGLPGYAPRDVCFIIQHFADSDYDLD